MVEVVAEILDEWRADAPRVVVHIADVDPRPLLDAIIHEQDLRGALQSPGARRSGGLDLVRTTMTERLASAVADLGLAPVRLEATDAELSEVIFAHPTLSEALQEAIHGLAGHMINF